MATKYKVISTCSKKREGANYNPPSYDTFQEALKELEDTVHELNRTGFLCIGLSKVF